MQQHGDEGRNTDRRGEHADRQLQRSDDRSRHRVDEDDEGTAAERLPNSRLSCQIKVRAELDGLVVRMPETQK